VTQDNNIQLHHGDHVAMGGRRPLRFFLHDINDPANVGSIFRVADAFGVEAIHLSGSSPVPPHRKINKTSRSSDKYVDFHYEQEPLVCLQQLREQGYTLVCLEITSESQDIRRLTFSAGDKVCLILGNENTGVDARFLSLAEFTAHINMAGHNSSMNVAVACGVASYEITRNYP